MIGTVRGMTGEGGRVEGRLRPLGAEGGGGGGGAKSWEAEAEVAATPT